MAKKPDNPNYKVIAENRRARYDYAIEDDIECGLMLEGSEVKSLRTGKAQITECYAAVEDGELWLVNSYIPPYAQARTFQHDRGEARLGSSESTTITRPQLEVQVIFWAITRCQLQVTVSISRTVFGNSVSLFTDLQYDNFHTRSEGIG
jgi:hypothetical protein